MLSLTKSGAIANWLVPLVLVFSLFSSSINALLIDPNTISPHWENVHYTRTIDLTRGYVRETDLLEIKNIDSQPQSEYFFTVNDGFDAVPSLSLIAASLSDSPKEIEPIKISNNVYKLILPFPVAPNSNLEFKVRYVYTNALTPLPAKIAMNQPHTILLKLNKFPYSPYLTNEYSLVFTGLSKGQEMQLNLPNIEELKSSSGFNFPDDFNPRVEEKALKYGPILTDIPAFTIDPIGLLYEHNRPIAKVNNLQRSIWLPASGADKISIEEYYELTNDAAALSLGFSRVEYMKGQYDRIRKHFSISHLEIPLTDDRKFDDYYYVDHVGQVSSHQIAHNHLILQPRFPIFGGWNYNFTLGWSNTLGNFVHKVLDREDTYIAKVPLLNTMRDVFYENVDVNFYLPEDAEFIGVAAPVDHKAIAINNELSYLDVSKGHVKVTVHFENMIDDMSKLDILVTYKYTPSQYWGKVIKISGFVFVTLLSFYLISLINISIDKQKSTEEKN